MIKLGMCTGDITNLSAVKCTEEAGFDYFEPALGSIYNLSDDEFEETYQKLSAFSIKAESVNCMLTGGVRVTGPEVNTQATHDYLDKAFARAERLGVKTVVFGSGGARQIPEGFDVAQGWRQIGNFLRLTEKHAAEHDITIAIEPLRKVESNVLNYVSEATLLASLINMPHIGVLGDTYHMAMGGEGFSSLTMAGDMLKHVHVANAIGRAFPKVGDGEKYEALFDTLYEMGFEGRVSVEATARDFNSECPEAFRALDAFRRK